jgi:hypothetical protein
MGSCHRKQQSGFSTVMTVEKDLWLTARRTLHMFDSNSSCWCARGDLALPFASRCLLPSCHTPFLSKYGSMPE